LASGIVTFAFGSPWITDPNMLLGMLTRTLFFYIGGGVPIYTQEDIREHVERQVASLTLASQEPGISPSTLRIARGAACWARKEKLSILHVVAAAPHLKRCVRDLRWALEEEGLSLNLMPHRNIRDYGPEVWFSRESTQLHTRSRFLWTIRESLLLHLPRALYERIGA
jgi:hypothetical protein